MVQLSLFELHQHLQDHTYFAVMSNLSAHNPATFNALLTALHALRYDDFKVLSACFAQTAAPQVEATAPATSALKTQFQQQYAAGRFARLLFPAPLPKATGKYR